MLHRASHHCVGTTTADYFIMLANFTYYMIAFPLVTSAKQLLLYDYSKIFLSYMWNRLISNWILSLLENGYLLNILQLVLFICNFSFKTPLRMKDYYRKFYSYIILFLQLYLTGVFSLFWFSQALLCCDVSESWSVKC